MGYQVLARKWRPRNFKEMVGQEHVLRMLTNALANQRLHHAYLFTGTRGVGKTTLARILAKCLNCEKGMSAEPCGQCKICESIDSGRFLDLIEIDAASRTKVEDTREILDNVQYAPSQGRFKIYLIDEVHMLSGHSFNALLKTLEEPPAHVKFLLATTDPKRLPITILSRCLQFNLKRVPVEQIEQHLQHICQQETISFEAPALHLLARAADGSMRDALSLLDQTIAFCQSQISLSETREMLGSIEQDAIYRLIESIATGDGKKLLTDLGELLQFAPDCSQILEELLNVLHQISIAQIVPDLRTESEFIKRFAEKFSAEDIQLYYQIALIGRRDLPLATSAAQGLEMTLLRMLAFNPMTFAESTSESNKHSAITQTQMKPEKSSSSVETRMASSQNLKQTQTLSAQELTPEVTASADSTKKAATSYKETSNVTVAHATVHSRVENPAETSSFDPVHLMKDLAHIKNWTELLPKLKLTGLAQALAANCSLLAVNASNIVLALAKKHETMLNKKLHERIEQTLSTYFQKPLKLEFKVTGEELETPAKVEQVEQETKLNNAAQAIKNDTHVQKLMDMFGGTLDLGSIKAVDT